MLPGRGPTFVNSLIINNYLAHRNEKAASAAKTGGRHISYRHLFAKFLVSATRAAAGQALHADSATHLPAAPAGMTGVRKTQSSL